MESKMTALNTTNLEIENPVTSRELVDLLLMHFSKKKKQAVMI